jgi:pimeloyl-ACP methyl ester carboxylesterase
MIMKKTTMKNAKVKYIISADDRKIAYHKISGKQPTVVYCGGFMSDMEGTKAIYLEQCCRELGLAYIRFDYSGHGLSSTDFKEGTIGKWKEDALAVIDQLSEGSLIIVGSSMGGWIGLLISLARKERIHAFIGVAAAPDFTRALMWDTFTDEIKRGLITEGFYYQPSEYSDEPYIISHTLIMEGDNHLILNKPIDLNCPARLFHGKLDKDVPPKWSSFIAENMTSDDVTLYINETGDHRLSSSEDLDRLKSALIELA